MGVSSGVTDEAGSDPSTQEAVAGEDLLGGALAFGAQPELGALGLVVLGAEYGGGERDVVDSVIFWQASHSLTRGLSLTPTHAT